MDNIYKNINELYTKGGFLERYGSDLLITILIILIFFIIFSYFLIMNLLIGKYLPLRNLAKLKATRPITPITNP